MISSRVPLTEHGITRRLYAAVREDDLISRSCPSCFGWQAKEARKLATGLTSHGCAVQSVAAWSEARIFLPITSFNTALRPYARQKDRFQLGANGWTGSATKQMIALSKRIRQSFSALRHVRLGTSQVWGSGLRAFATT